MLITTNLRLRQLSRVCNRLQSPETGHRAPGFPPFCHPPLYRTQGTFWTRGS